MGTEIGLIAAGLADLALRLDSLSKRESAAGMAKVAESENGLTGGSGAKSLPKDDFRPETGYPDLSGERLVQRRRVGISAGKVALGVGLVMLVVAAGLFAREKIWAVGPWGRCSLVFVAGWASLFTGIRIESRFGAVAGQAVQGFALALGFVSAGMAGLHYALFPVFFAVAACAVMAAGFVWFSTRKGCPWLSGVGCAGALVVPHLADNAPALLLGGYVLACVASAVFVGLSRKWRQPLMVAEVGAIAFFVFVAPPVADGRVFMDLLTGCVMGLTLYAAMRMDTSPAMERSLSGTAVPLAAIVSAAMSCLFLLWFATLSSGPAAVAAVLVPAACCVPAAMGRGAARPLAISCAALLVPTAMLPVLSGSALAAGVALAGGAYALVSSRIDNPVLAVLGAGLVLLASVGFLDEPGGDRVVPVIVSLSCLACLCGHSPSRKVRLTVFPACVLMSFLVGSSAVEGLFPGSVMVLACGLCVVMSAVAAGRDDRFLSSAAMGVSFLLAAKAVFFPGCGWERVIETGVSGLALLSFAKDEMSKGFSRWKKKTDPA